MVLSTLHLTTLPNQTILTVLKGKHFKKINNLDVLGH